MRQERLSDTNNLGNLMYDIPYLRKLAERYRKLARSFEHDMIRERLHALAEDLEAQIRHLRQPYRPVPVVRQRYDRIN